MPATIRPATIRPATIRPATASDLSRIADLSIAAAERRRAADPALWPLARNARERVEVALGTGLDGADPSARPFGLVAEASGRIVGAAHAMMLPVPPIYAGALGPPGLLLDDCVTADDAPPGTAEALLAAAEAALREAGAGVLLASCVAGAAWRPVLDGHGYEPITSYWGKAGFEARDLAPGVRPAAADDVPGIVAASAEHRRILEALSPFWTPHPDADARFDRWMRRSLDLPDRDMLVSGARGAVRGYVVAQPVSSLLLPVAHDPGPVGVIDDFYDRDFADVSVAETPDGGSAAALLVAAETAFARRGVEAALVVCPAAWASKASVLEREGYRAVKLWMLKR